MDEKDQEIARLKAALESKDPGPAPKLGKKKGPPLWAWILVAIGGFAALAALTPDSPAVETGAGAATRAGAGDPNAMPRPAKSWAYSEDTDPLTDKVTKSACSLSTNEVRLDFPYKDVPASLCLRAAPRSGVNVYLQLRGDGQIMCTSYDGCAVNVRFGSGAMQKFSAAGASDNSSNVVFITNAARFIEGLKSAPVTKVEIELYQAGNQVLEFPTDGLEWPRPATT